MTTCQILDTVQILEVTNLPGLVNDQAGRGKKKHSNYVPNVVMVPLFGALFTSFCPTRTAPVLGKETNALLWILALKCVKAQRM